MFSLVLVAAFARIDAYLKSSPAPGYCPENTRFLLVSSDFGGFWAGVERSDVYGKITTELPRPLGRFELRLRELTGIRPTPPRWRLWMGRRLLAAQSEEGFGICVRPGVMLRVAEFLHKRFGGAEDTDGVRRFTPYYYVWRDGFLILSKERAYVEAALRAPVPAVSPNVPPKALRVHWGGMHDGAITVYGRDRFPVDGWANAAIRPRVESLTLSSTWPGEPLFIVTASRWRDIHALADLVSSAVLADSTHGEVLASGLDILREKWGLATLPTDWDEAFDQCSFAVAGLDTSETLPVPEMALLLHALQPPKVPHPLQALVEDGESIPYEWNLQPGTMTPVLGEKLTLCLNRQGNYWLAASQEPLMAGLAGRLRPPTPAYADAMAQLNWAKAGPALEHLTLEAGALELIPGMNETGVQRSLAPLARALGELDTLWLTFRAEGSRVSFHGHLSGPVGAE